MPKMFLSMRIQTHTTHSQHLRHLRIFGVRSAQERAPAAPRRASRTPREMLMPHSEPEADANDLPRELHIELQQMVEDAQQEEDRNPAPPSPQPTSSIVRPAGGE